METDFAASVDELARRLDAARQDGGVPVPNGLSIADGYVVQAAVFAARGKPLSAWKIGLTNKAAQRGKGTDSPAAGRLSADAMFPSGARIAPPAGELYVEGELVVELATDLLPAMAPFDPDKIASVTGRVHAGIEVVTTRFVTSELPIGALIADNCMADRLIIGEMLATGWKPQLADIPVALDINGHPVAVGSTSAVMGNPLFAVAWLANWLAEQGLGLTRGQLISSGTCTGITEAAAGDMVAVRFPGFGSATVHFTD